VPRHARGARPRRLAAHVEDVGTLPQQLEPVRHRGGRLEPLPAVGERVGRHVDHAHDERPAGAGQIGQAVHPGVPGGVAGAGGHRHFPAMRLMASARVAASRMTPRTAEVMVRAPGLRTPRMDMHRCSHSTTTSTPRGSRISTRESAVWVVIRSCAWGRRANTSTSRASLLRPVMRPSTLGMYPTCATPWKGTRWCSHVEYTSMSLTSTISSCPRSKV